jgi:hypothetical protein
MLSALNFNATSENCVLVVQHFNGFTGTPTLDKKSTSSNVSSTTITSGATATLAQAVELVIGLGIHASTTSLISLGAGYTNLTEVSIAAREAAMESKVVAATTAVTATFSIALARVNIGGVVTFYAASTTQNLTAPFISAASLILAPVLIMILLNALIGPTSTLFAPTVALGPLTLSPPIINSSNTMFNPVVLPQPVTLTAPTIASGSATSTPALSLVLALGFIASSAVIYPPALTLGVYTMTTPALGPGLIMLTPNVTLGGVTLTNPTIPSNTVLFPPVAARVLNPNELLLLGVG